MHQVTAEDHRSTGVDRELPSAPAGPSSAWLMAAVAGLAAAAVTMAVLAGQLDGAPRASAGDQILLLLLLLSGAAVGLELRTRGGSNTLDLFDAALGAALVALPGPRLLVLVVLAKAAALAVRRVEATKLCFNLAQWGAAAAAGSLVLAGLRPSGPPTGADLLLVPVALLVVAVLNTTSVQLVLAGTGGAPTSDVRSRAGLQGLGVNALINMSLGLLSAALWVQAPASRPVIPVLFLLVHLSTRRWADHQAARRRLVGLQRAGAALAGPDDLHTATPAFLSELRQAFHCAGVVVQFQPLPPAPDPESRRRGSGGWLRISDGYDTGEAASAELVAELLSRGKALRLGGGEGEPALREALAAAGWRDCLAAPVRVDDVTVGLLCTHDREGWDGFEDTELEVLEAAAGLLAAAVSRARLADVLREERAALAASEARWRSLAGVLEMVALGSDLPVTLDRLARTVEAQTSGAHCAVLVRAGGERIAHVAPTLPAPFAAEVEQALLAVLPTDRCSAAPTRPGPYSVAVPGAGVLRAWPVPCSGDSGGSAVLALYYPEGGPDDEHSRPAVDGARVAALAVDHVLVLRRLSHQAGHDALTSLPNRAVYLDRVGHALRATERSAAHVLLLFLDLDRFKLVNDSLGHAAGDELLRSVAARLQSSVRPGDTVARFGGDEFTMLCEGIIDEAHALQVVHRVQAALAAPFPLGDSELFATSSIGIALGGGSAQTPETLVQDADAAMYRAKARGGNCYELFDGAMRERAVRRLATQSALHRAIERSEFRVVYQPVVRLSTGRVEGVEALVRWARPASPLVQPADFVPLAEETGLIVPIGRHVLQVACQQARAWRDERPDEVPPWVSINLSGRQLTDPGLVPSVQDALERSGVDPATISLEITESVLMSDGSASAQVLSDLKELGVHLFVDDFGTGYSSLTHLRQFPLDGVKVDQSFVAGLGERADDTAIVRAVIGLAHSLGLTAVAEGVETPDQASRLIDLDCDVAQGYHLGRPVPAAEVPFELGVPPTVRLGATVLGHTARH